MPQWGWVPFSGASDALAKATDAATAVSDEVARLAQEVAEAEAGAEVLRETAALEKSRAEQLKTGARTCAHVRARAPGAEDEAVECIVLRCDCSMQDLLLVPRCSRRDLSERGGRACDR